LLDGGPPIVPAVPPSPSRLAIASLALCAAVFAGSCVKHLERELVHPDQLRTLDNTSPYLKVHLRSGYVYVLAAWQVDSLAHAIEGRGELLDVRRVRVDSGRFRMPLDSVALLETNVLRRSGAATALTVMAGVTAAVAGVCAASPKTCFGSCPTFYAPDSAGVERLQAEGFSASIAPALEATDVDMLYHVRARGRDFTIRVTNEALETHVIRLANLLVAPRPERGRVFATPEGTFRAATALTPPSRCAAPEGDCRATMLAADGHERSSLADSTDLATRETIELGFDRVPPGPVGLVITARQSLMTTFLVYQALAYLGSDAVRWLVSLETAGPASREDARALGRVLGRIDVLVPDAAGDWTPAGSVGETGPLAADTKIVPLPQGDATPRRVRLRFTRGLWRLDYVALAALGDSVRPARIQPVRVLRAGRGAPAAREALRDSTRTLATLPGDVYELVYRLPPHPERLDFFLEARGYYLEWMRREWSPEQNPLLALRLAVDPAGALRALAPAYKRLEPQMEHLFWNSRYVVQ
jgi:hypothetical protein